MNPEIVGLIGAVILVYSLLMTDVIKLRKLGMVSNGCYIIYSLMFSPVLYSILIINVLIFCIHTYKVIKK